MNHVQEAALHTARVKIMARLRKELPNSIEVWEEDGSILLGFGDFVAEIDEREIAYVAGVEQ